MAGSGTLTSCWSPGLAIGGSGSASQYIAGSRHKKKTFLCSNFEYAEKQRNRTTLWKWGCKKNLIGWTFFVGSYGCLPVVYLRTIIPSRNTHHPNINPLESMHPVPNCFHTKNMCITLLGTKTIKVFFKRSTKRSRSRRVVKSVKTTETPEYLGKPEFFSFF